MVSSAVAPTLQHSTMIGPSKPAAFSVLNTAHEVHSSRTELNHHVALRCAAILRAEAGDVLGNRLQLFDRVFVRVVDDVAGVVPDLEVGVPDRMERRRDLGRRAAAAAVRLHHQLDLTFMRVRRRITHHLVEVIVFSGLVDAERQHERQSKRSRVVDLTTNLGDRIGERDIVPRAQRAHLCLQPAGGEPLFQTGEVLGRCLGGDEWLVFGPRQQARRVVASGLDLPQRIVERPRRPGAVETADRPADGGIERPRAGRAERGGGPVDERALEKRASIHRAT